MFLKLANILELTEVQIKVKFFFQIKLFIKGESTMTIIKPRGKNDNTHVSITHLSGKAFITCFFNSSSVFYFLSQSAKGNV